jgi:prepilin-type N-terminal cleavage/methylation domain-containing protein/prepilin-type processing-associated H-X9-DG protein
MQIDRRRGRGATGKTPFLPIHRAIFRIWRAELPLTKGRSMTSRSPRRTGFTLIEVLVAVAVIGILMALLLPAVQSARSSARRVMCANQLRQMGLALHLYHDSHLCFPPGSYVMGPSFPMQTGWGWGAMILPALEQQALHEQIDFGSGTAVGNNLSLIASSIPLWRCPAEVAPEQIEAFPLDHLPFLLAAGNYCGSEGVLAAMSRVRISDIRDGTSRTLLLGERMVQTGENGALPFTSAWCGQVAFADVYEYRSVPHLFASRQHPINASPSDPVCFGGRHAGGANFVFADGSERFLNENMDGNVFESLGTASGGETYAAP